MNLIHALYLQSKRIQNINEYARQQQQQAQQLATTMSSTTSSESMASFGMGFTSPELQAIESLINQGRYTWIKNTVFKNTQFMHVQVAITISQLESHCDL